jgi:hypothetical protein
MFFGVNEIFIAKRQKSVLQYYLFSGLPPNGLCAQNRWLTAVVRAAHPDDHLRRNRCDDGAEPP